MPRKLHQKGGKLDIDVELAIESFLNYEEYPQTFGNIKEYLKSKNIVYKNSDKDRSGLAHTLNRMIKKHRIKKIPRDPLSKKPLYVSLEKSTFDASFDGFIRRTEYTTFLYKPLPYLRGDSDIDNIFKRTTLNYKEKQIQKLITFLGIQILYSVITSYERPINKTSSGKINKQNHEVWLKNALSLHDPLEPIGDIVSRLFSKESTTKLKELIKEMYPHITGRLESAEEGLDEIKNSLRASYLKRPDFAVRMRN